MDLLPKPSFFQQNRKMIGFVTGLILGSVAAVGIVVATGGLALIPFVGAMAAVGGAALLGAACGEAIGRTSASAVVASNNQVDKPVVRKESKRDEEKGSKMTSLPSKRNQNDEQRVKGKAVRYSQPSFGQNVNGMFVNGSTESTLSNNTSESTLADSFMTDDDNELNELLGEHKLR